MISDRSYRAPMVTQAALAELRRGADTQLDPAVVERLTRVALGSARDRDRGRGRVRAAA